MARGKTEYKFYVRQFLNNPKVYGPAFILASMAKTKYIKKDKKTKKVKIEYGRWAELQIGDCSRIINLDLDLCSIVTARQNLKKISKLANILKKFEIVYAQQLKEMIQERKMGQSRKNRFSIE